MSTVAPDLYSISMDDLRKIAETATAEITPVAPAAELEAEQPRDEKGRFIKADDTNPDPGSVDITKAVSADDVAPVEEYTATIDIGDGAGIQVFSAPDKDALLAKLIEAQENATRKIRELTAKPVEPAKPAEPTPDEELELAQEFLANPSKAFDRLYQQRRSEELKREAEARKAAEEAAKAIDTAAKRFIAANPDYYENPKNAARIEGWLKLNGNLEPTFENFTAAYNDLKTDGLLLSKPDPAAPARPNSSGISVRRSSAPAPVKTAAQALDELYKMPLDKLRDSLMAPR